MKTFFTFIGAVVLTIAVSLFGLTGFMFLDAGTDWLTKTIGGAMVVLAFLLVSLAFTVIKMNAQYIKR